MCAEREVVVLLVRSASGCTPPRNGLCPCASGSTSAASEPFWTYCANHPHCRPQRDPIPIGPVFTDDGAGEREVWQPSPDMEEIRQHLPALVAATNEHPVVEYPLGGHTEDVVVWQLGEFRGVRAVDELHRIAGLDESAPKRTRGAGAMGSRLAFSVPRRRVSSSCAAHSLDDSTKDCLQELVGGMIAGRLEPCEEVRHVQRGLAPRGHRDAKHSRHG